MVGHFVGLRGLHATELRRLISLARDHLAGNIGDLVPAGHCATILWPRFPSDEPTIAGRERQLCGEYQAGVERLGWLPLLADVDASQKVRDLVETLTSEIARVGLAFDGLVVRHFAAGVPTQIMGFDIIEKTGAFVVNAGDGANENPIEALAQIVCLDQVGVLSPETKCLAVGDVQHNPTARSLVWGLAALGLDVHILAPPGLVPDVWPAQRPIVVHHWPTTIMPLYDIVVSAPITSAVSKSEFLPPTEDLKNLFDVEPYLGLHPIRIACSAAATNVYYDPLESLERRLIEQPSREALRASITAAVSFASRIS